MIYRNRPFKERRATSPEALRTRSDKEAEAQCTTEQLSLMSGLPSTLALESDLLGGSVKKCGTVDLKTS